MNTFLLFLSNMFVNLVLRHDEVNENFAHLITYLYEFLFISLFPHASFEL